jgi:hypothetical protein
VAEITRYSGRGYWKDRMGYKTNAIGISCDDFGKLKTFLDKMQEYTNLALLRYMLTATTTERKIGASTDTGHFDLAGYVARLSFYNYSAEDLGDSPGVSLQLPSPKDDILEETKTGIWVVKEDIGEAIATAMSAALNGDEIEYVGGEVPEN